MKQLILWCIRFYQKTLSLDTGLLHYMFPGIKVCRFSPTCSEYTYQAISRYGIIMGLQMGMKRISRCHPWNSGGYDPLPSLENRKKNI